MTCEKARRSVVIGRRWPFGRRAERHVKDCPDCAKWLGSVTEMAELLEKVPHHEQPARLAQRLITEAQNCVPAPADGRVRAPMTLNIGRLTMRKIIVLTACFVLAAWMAFFEFGRGGRGIAVAELRQALAGVNVIHMVGAEGGYEGPYGDPSGIRALVNRKDKWLRASPLGFYETNTNVGMPASSPDNHYIFAGNATVQYFYFPRRGNQVSSTTKMGQSLMDQMMSIIKPSDSALAEWTFVGWTKLDGVDLELLEVQGDKSTTELAVDPKTKLTFRYREFVRGYGDKMVLVTDLRFSYSDTPPAGVFDWRPPANAVYIKKRSHSKIARATQKGPHTASSATVR